jgi:hypothetical protein
LSIKSVVLKLSFDQKRRSTKRQLEVRRRGEIRWSHRDRGWKVLSPAIFAGIHRTWVSDIERGKGNPTASVVEKLAGPLGVEVGRLLD